MQYLGLTQQNLLMSLLPKNPKGQLQMPNFDEMSLQY